MGAHDHHRERMRKRYYLSGFDSFSNHEILEMLLYYSIPRGDTNELAHRLIERFGDFNHVIEATPDELKSVKGIGDASAILLKLIEASLRVYASAYVESEVRYDTIKKIADFMWPRFFGLDHERLYMLLLNNKMGIIDCIVLSEGAINATTIQARYIIERTIAKKAAGVVLAHNHPHGLATPSESDVLLTKRLYEGLALIDIPLVEHIVFAENRFVPIVKTKLGNLAQPWGNATSMEANLLEPSRFYDVDEESYRFEPLFQKILGIDQ